jgi:phytoene desaturase
MAKNVCIIGAGIGGLSAAVYLAKLGFEVDIYENNSTVGGKVNLIEENGFRFGTGASLVTMPFVLSELFNFAGENLDEYLTFDKLKILCKYFFSDGTKINAYSDNTSFADEIANKTNDSAESVISYLNYCKRIYELTGDLFLKKSFLLPGTFFNRKAATALLNIKKLDTHRTMNEANKSYFADPKTIQLFNRYATYNGSSPFLTPATLNIIQHVECNLGGYTCRGGMYQIPKALAALAKKLNTKIFTDTVVNKICVSDKKVIGIEVDNKLKPYNVVISNADVNYTYKYLLNDAKTKMAKRYSRLEKSSSAIVFYWGIKGLHSELEIHNILFSENYEDEFNDIFSHGTITDDPTVYIYISSKFNEADAPDGCENWFVMINVPHDKDHDWDTLVKVARKNIISKISQYLKIELEKKIVFEEVLHPKKILIETNSDAGSIYGISSNNKMSAFLRQQNKSKYYNGLYFCGGSTHPGGGVPLVILSGKIASELVNKYE